MDAFVERSRIVAWMRMVATVAAVVLGLAAFAVLAWPAPAEIQHPRLAMYSRVAGDGSPFLRADGRLDSSTIRSQARWDVVVLDASPISEYRPDIALALRKANPKIQLLAFVLGHDFWVNPNPAMGDTSRNFPWKYWQAVRSTDGGIWTRGGRRIPSLSVNLARRDACGRYTTAEALADTILRAVVKTRLWDGLFVDVNCPTIGWMQDSRDSIDYARAGYATWDDFARGWTAGRRAFIDRIRLGVDPGFLIVGNCGPCGEFDLYNGWMRENFPNQNGGTWQSNMLQTAWGAPGYLADDSLYTGPRLSWLSSMPVNLDPSDPENQRRLRFGLASAALGNGVHTFVRGPDPLRWYSPWWFDEYSVTAGGRASSSMANRGWLGAAAGKAYPLEHGPWRRDFAKGAVVINPNLTRELVRLGARYKRILGRLPVNDGVTADSVWVDGRDARFLLRVTP
jgi:hypothetical protein